MARKLYRSLRTDTIVHQDMANFHYPCRWKYDCFRGLEYFARTGHLYDVRMQDALDLAKEALTKGYINRGKQYSGKVHFPLETGTKGRFNTYRALFILKHLERESYQKIIHTDYPQLDTN